MKDIVGEDIQLGQQIAFPEPGYRNLVVGTVTKVTKCFCFADYMSNSPDKEEGHVYTVKLHPYQVKVIHPCT